MSYDAIFGNSPTGTALASPSATVAAGFDKSTGSEWVAFGAGWQPVSPSIARSVFLNQTAAAIANVLTFTAPVTGLYQIVGYAAQATSTGGTLPSVAVAYTEGDTSASITGKQVIATGTTTTQGMSDSGSVIINVLGGTQIVVSSAAAATLTYNLKARINYVG